MRSPSRYVTGSSSRSSAIGFARSSTALSSVYGHFGQYNLGGIDVPVGRLKKLKDNRYEGYFYGAGLSLGHQWILSKHLNLEASLGGGWARTPYKKYECPRCSPLLDESTYDYFGITRATLSLTYFFN